MIYDKERKVYYATEAELRQLGRPKIPAWALLPLVIAVLQVALAWYVTSTGKPLLWLAPRGWHEPAERPPVK